MLSKKYHSQAGFLEIAILGIGVVGMLAAVALLGLNSARAKSRDAKRVADIRQMASALELYRNDKDQYPDKLSTLTPNYIGLIPTPPTPADGTCTLEQNSYTYFKTGEKTYQITFCLGASTGGYGAGPHKLTEEGIY